MAFPQDLDTDTELYAVEDDVHDVIAAHHNALKDAVMAIEEKLGIDGSGIVATIDYILKQLAIKSEPPSGKYRVTNIYVTHHPSGKLHVDYDDTPIP